MKKKKYMIRCDIEGVTGVVSYKQAEPGQSEYAFGQRMFMSDLRACYEGLLDGGADEVVIYDEHYYGRNIDLDVLPARVSAICGKPPYRADWPGGLDESYDGMILLGFHSKFGTPHGLLHHSYELDIRNLLLNGVSVGEIGMEAAIAGDCQVPVLMVAGDSAGTAEAEKLLGPIGTVVVKETLGETGGWCYPAGQTAQWIRAAAQGIVRHPPQTRPYRVSGPVTLEIEFNDGAYLNALRQEYRSLMINDRTLMIHAATATAAWADYWQKKLHVQGVMS